MCIKEAKHCWGILKDGFVQRKTPALSTPKGNGKKRGRDHFAQEDVFNEAAVAEPPCVVSENAWPVLDWLVGVFEQDEILTEGLGLREMLMAFPLIITR